MAPPTGEPEAREGDRARLARSALLDVGPVVLLAIVTFTTGEVDRPRGELATLLVVLPLLARRRWPIPVFLAVAAGSVATATETNTPWVQVTAVMVAAFTVGELAIDRAGSALVVLVVSALLAFGFLAQDAEPVEAIVLPFALLVPSWLLGDIVRGRRIEARRRADDVARELREQEARLAVAAADERRHVARELHDVVSHAVSVMVIQAGAARQVLRSAPDDAEQALMAVETTGREAMAELRRFLGALSDDEAAGLAPQPGIDQLPVLVERVREAGLPASLEVAGEARSVPASIEVTAFRIVQEALTNALRYAGRAATLVRLVWEPDELRLEILDDGPATSATGGTSGRGLVGMRERAALVGGRLEAGPRVGGGFAVRAWLPLEPATGALPATGSGSP
jgi:signal transduction histidine kinase